MVEFDKEKVVKLVFVLVLTLAALAVMSILVQVIQTVLPFLIVGAGIYAAYRWALNEAPAPTADEVEEQARGIFSRFRRSEENGRGDGEGGRSAGRSRRRAGASGRKSDTTIKGTVGGGPLGTDR